MTQVSIDIASETKRSRLWEPVISSEAQRLALPVNGRSTILTEAADALGKCLPPTAAPGSRTGLVTGYVQSGKTMSFTAVMALARDNGFRLIILIAGTTKNLHAQSLERLRTDLQLDKRGASAPWRHIDSPRVTAHSHVAIDDTLAEWTDDEVPDQEKKTVLITVLKGHQRLAHLRNVLERCTRLSDAPALIIDDEGDQAGLNSDVNAGGQSTTYSRILEIKDQLPRHSYLLYTATPQAPLLINIADLLAPDFCVVLTPGAGYTGGQVFFAEGSPIVKTIPPAEIPSRNNPLAQPPQTLLDALRFFTLGVAVGIVTEDGSKNRSMLVHPSSLTAGHALYGTWVSSVRSAWIRTFEADPADPDRIELLDEFSDIFAEMSAGGVPSINFAQVAPRLVHALRRTTVKVVNSEHDTNVDWSQSYSWILVGGQAMDRGFTVNGLTVTYMPRLLGVGNADTVQQRARFFGYKQDYLPLCRVFVDAQVEHAFREYLEHEEDMRAQLLKLQSENASVRDWKRRFVLSGGLRPTRDAVLDIAYDAIRLGDEWLQLNLDHPIAGVRDENSNIVDKFVCSLSWAVLTDGDLRGETSKRNQIARCSVSSVLTDLLLDIRPSSAHDSRLLSVLLRAMAKHQVALESAPLAVIRMSGGEPREREIVDGTVTQLFQGAQYAGGRKVYLGDRSVRDDSTITLQVHLVRAVGSNRTPRPVLAIYVPRHLGIDVVYQPQGVSA